MTSAALEQTLIEMQVGDPEKADEDFHKIISNATRNNAMKIAVENFSSFRETIGFDKGSLW